MSRSRDRPAGDVKPTRTLFVINFDLIRTKIRDIERHFEPYGKITNIRVRRYFVFVQYETQEEASAAVKNTDKRYASICCPSYSPIFQSLVCCSIAITPSSMLMVFPHSLHFRLNLKLLLHYNQDNLFLMN